MELIPMWVQTTVLTYYIIWSALELFILSKYVWFNSNLIWLQYHEPVQYTDCKLKWTWYWWILNVAILNFIVS